MSGGAARSATFLLKIPYSRYAFRQHWLRRRRGRDGRRLLACHHLRRSDYGRTLDGALGFWHSAVRRTACSLQRLRTERRPCHCFFAGRLNGIACTTPSCQCGFCLPSWLQLTRSCAALPSGLWHSFPAGLHIPLSPSPHLVLASPYVYVLC